MKKFALSVLYVFSIVLAVGIGMSQVALEKHDGRSVQGRAENLACGRITFTSAGSAIAKNVCPGTNCTNNYGRFVADATSGLGCKDVGGNQCKQDDGLCTSVIQNIACVTEAACQ